MSTHNQPQKKQETHNQARARAITYHRSQSRPSYATINTILLLLLLEENHNASEKHGTQASSLTLGALTLSLALSPPASTTAPHQQEIPHFHCDVRLPSSSTSTSFRGHGLVHQQQGSVSVRQQVRARCLPRTDRGLPTVFYQAHWELPSVTSSTFCAFGPRTWRQRDKWGTTEQNCGWATTIQLATLTNLRSVW